MSTSKATPAPTSTPNLMISASFAASGAFAQVSRDISAKLEESSAQQLKSPTHHLSIALMEHDHNANNDDSLSVESSSLLSFEPRLEDEAPMMMMGDEYDDLFAPRLEAASPDSAHSKKQKKMLYHQSPEKLMRGSASTSSSTDFLTKCFDGLKFFHQRQPAANTVNDGSSSISYVTSSSNSTPEALAAFDKGSYIFNSSSSSPRGMSSSNVAKPTNKATTTGSTSTIGTTTPTLKRNTLANMVHSIDLALFSKPSKAQHTSESTATTVPPVHSIDLARFSKTSKQQRTSESTTTATVPPVFAKIGSIITGKGVRIGGGSREGAGGDDASSSGASSEADAIMTTSDSFHTCHMNEDSIMSGSSNGSPDKLSYSSTKKRKAPETQTSPTMSDTESSELKEQILPLLATSATSVTSFPPSTPSRARTASSFQSSQYCHRIKYRLKEGLEGMSPRSKEAFPSFLPRLFHLGQKKKTTQPSLMDRFKQRQASFSSTTSSSPTPKKKNTTTASNYNNNKNAALPDKLYVLLLEIPNKLFEICPVDFVHRDMTVGDVLAKVRTQASDPVLAAQSYKSLINGQCMEFSAPMLPVSLLLDDCNSSQETNKKPLLTALPPNASASQCRHIQSILMNHPTMQRFWQRDDPFDPSPPKKQRRH